jgi:hypothetical protein
MKSYIKYGAQYIFSDYICRVLLYNRQAAVPSAACVCTSIMSTYIFRDVEQRSFAVTRPSVLVRSDTYDTSSSERMGRGDNEQTSAAIEGEKLPAPVDSLNRNNDTLMHPIICRVSRMSLRPALFRHLIFLHSQAGTLFFTYIYTVF